MKNNILFTFLFCLIGLAFFFTSCSKKKDNSNTTTGIYYYKASINGTSYTETATDDGKVDAGSGVNGTDDVSIYATVTSNIAGGTGLGILKGLMPNFLQASKADLKNFFAAGSYPYSVDAQNGIEVSLTDKNGKIWSTSLGSADQGGSNFKITSVVDDPDAANRYYVKVSATFNCTLYDDSNNKLTLTNGQFVGAFGPLN